MTGPLGCDLCHPATSHTSDLVPPPFAGRSRGHLGCPEGDAGHVARSQDPTQPGFWCRFFPVHFALSLLCHGICYAAKPVLYDKVCAISGAAAAESLADFIPATSGGGLSSTSGRGPATEPDPENGSAIVQRMDALDAKRDAVRLRLTMPHHAS